MRGRLLSGEYFVCAYPPWPPFDRLRAGPFVRGAKPRAGGRDRAARTTCVPTPRGPPSTGSGQAPS